MVTGVVAPYLFHALQLNQNQVNRPEIAPDFPPETRGVSGMLG
jgi:hypothetical protein